MQMSIAIRNHKLKQFMFELSDALSPSMRGVALPTGRYLTIFGDYLN
jgi:hypothetical protein